MSPPEGCVANTSLGVGCTVGRSLDLPAALTLSPDQANLYVPTFVSEAVTVFSRDGDTGKPTQLPGAAGCIDQVGDGVTCADGRGLRGAASTEVSPDGENIYVASRFSKAVVTLERDPTTGALTQKDCIADFATAGTEKCSVAPFPLGGVNSVSISPDGRQLYAGSFDGDQVSVFARDTETGALTMVSCINATGSGGCAAGRGLGKVFAVNATADGENLYATAYAGDAVAVFARDGTTGALTQLPGADGCVAELGDGVTCADGVGLDGSHDVRSSADGSHVYVAANESDAVTIYARDTATGALAPSGCVSRAPLDGCGSTARGIDGVQAVALSPGDDSVYGAAVADDALSSFAREATSGDMSQLAETAGCISETGSGGACDDGVALDAGAALTVTSDGRFAYAVAAGSDAITTYERGARPVASFTATPDPAEVSQTVSFDGSASSDADGSVIRYEWDLDGDGGYETDTGSTPTASRSYDAAGSVTVALRVTDDDANRGVATRTVTVFVPDSSPPAAPSGLVATGGDGSVALDWADNAESDLAGYDVFRATVAGGPYVKANVDRLTASSYTDGGLTNGTQYFYVVRAVDASGNVSGDSAEVSATPQAPPPSAYRSAVLGTAGLVSYWRLGESAGDVAADETGANAGSFVGGPLLSAAGALVDDPDTAVRFDGVNDEMSVTGTGLALGSSGSLEGWFDVGSGVATLRDHTRVGGWILSFNSSGKLAYRLGGTTFVTARDYGTLGGGWHHVVATKSGSTTALYVDGELVHSGTGAGSTVAKLPWHGMRNGDRSEFTAGGADEIAVYDQALSATTISEHYQAGTASDPPPPDSSPPAAPSGLVATGGDGSVALDWADNAESDLAGYD
ncbi:MAG: beta-propeller fold lactonase family protein, partial [Actinomycetota bacterium]|nr:beta-propeller fold lactonase family protein [Actinomycetota bacterium]